MDLTNKPHFTFFSLFPCLTPEIRQMIWELCLPTYVLDLDEPQLPIALKQSQFSEIIPEELEDEPCCSWTSTRSKQLRDATTSPPVISRVCREARAVALRNRAGSSETYYSIPRWLDPVRNVLHLNWNQHVVDDFNFPYFPGIVAILARSKAERVSVTYNLANVFWPRERDRDIPIPDQLAARSAYELCLGTVIIHVTGVNEERREKVIDSGLFGLFGENVAELVPVTDHARWSRLEEFNAAHGSPADVRATYFFNNYRREDVRKHMHTMEAAWVKYRWDAAKEKASPIEDPDTVWRLVPDLPFRAVDFNAPNREHPWVIEVIDSIPRFKPAYMVRLCWEGCT